MTPKTHSSTCKEAIFRPLNISDVFVFYVYIVPHSTNYIVSLTYRFFHFAFATPKHMLKLFLLIISITQLLDPKKENSLRKKPQSFFVQRHPFINEKGHSERSIFLATGHHVYQLARNVLDHQF